MSPDIICVYLCGGKCVFCLGLADPSIPFNPPLPHPLRGLYILPAPCSLSFEDSSPKNSDSLEPLLSWHVMSSGTPGVGTGGNTERSAGEVLFLKGFVFMLFFFLFSLVPSALR